MLARSSPIFVPRIALPILIAATATTSIAFTSELAAAGVLRFGRVATTTKVFDRTVVC
jgi:hypothetical protein